MREASHSIRVAGWLESLLADVNFGWRQLWRNKITSAAAVLSLALGIGSCVGAFRLIDALLWRPLPISGASSLYVLSRKMTGLYGKPAEDGYWATPEFKRHARCRQGPGRPHRHQRRRSHRHHLVHQ